MAAAPIIVTTSGISTAGVLLGLGGLALGGGVLYLLLRPKERPFSGSYDPYAPVGTPGYRPLPGIPGSAPGGPRPPSPSSQGGPSGAQTATGLVQASGGLLSTLGNLFGNLFGGDSSDTGVIDTREEWERALERTEESQSELDRMMREALGQDRPSAWDFGPPEPPAWESNPEGWLGDAPQDWTGFAETDLDALYMTGQISENQYHDAMEQLGYEGSWEEVAGTSFDESWMNGSDYDVPDYGNVEYDPSAEFTV